MGFLSSVFDGIKSVANTLSPFAGLAGGYLTSEGQEDINEANVANALQLQQFNAAEALKSRIWSAQQARILRKWQRNLSNTAHQREVRDLRLAGLNPILSARGSGASVPGGSMPSSSSASAGQLPHLENPTAKGISASMDIQQGIANIQSINAGIERTKAETQKVISEKNKVDAEAAREGYDEYSGKVDPFLYGNRQRYRNLETEKIANEVDKVAAEISNINEQARLAERSGDLKLSEKLLADGKVQLMREVTLPNGKLDVQRATMLLRQLEMEQSIYDSPRGRVYKEMEVAGRSSSAVHALTDVARTGTGIVSAINLLKGFIRNPNKFRRIYPFTRSR